MKENLTENNTLVRYIATIIVGDKYHKKGEEFRVSEFDLENVKENGLRLEVYDEKFRDDRTVYHFYPVSIRKMTYQLTLTEVDTIEGGDRKKQEKWGQLIGYDSYDNHEYDWREHWP